jgi:hypothetical protein
VSDAGEGGDEARVVSPVRVADVLVFSAEELIRAAVSALEGAAPGVRARVLASPAQITAYKSDRATVLVADDAGLELADTDALRANCRDLVVVLFSFNEVVCCAPPRVALERMPFTAKADMVFAVDRASLAPDRVIASAVRAAEDFLNVEKYSRAKRFIFLVVDDEPRWFSQFLHVLYDIIGDRAAVRLLRTYEQALEFIFGVADESQITPEFRPRSGRGEDVVCLVTDILFPKGDAVTGEAGRDLVRLVSEHYPNCPIIIASKAKEAEELRDRFFVLPKGDYGSLERLKRYILDHTDLGGAPGVRR